MTATRIDLTTGEQVQGTLPVANGGTGAVTLTGLLKGNGTSAVTAVTAPSGAVVGTTDTQTLSGKTIVGSSNTISAIPTSALVLGGAAGAVVATSETCSSTSYADLATTTDTVTVTIGASGMAQVFISSQSAYVSGSANFPCTSFAISGATTLAASDSLSASLQNAGMQGVPFLLTGLAAGSTTFKMKYRITAAGSWNFSARRIGVIPL